MHRDLVSVAHTVVVCSLLSSRLIIKDKENANVQLLQQTHGNVERCNERDFQHKDCRQHSIVPFMDFTRCLNTNPQVVFYLSDVSSPSALPPPIIIIIIYCIYKDGVELITIYDFLWVSQDKKVPWIMG